jgi:hypothetical protein
MRRKNSRLFTRRRLECIPYCASWNYALVRETKAIDGAGIILSDLKSGSRAANLERKAVSPIVKSDVAVNDALEKLVSHSDSKIFKTAIS